MNSSDSSAPASQDPERLEILRHRLEGFIRLRGEPLRESDEIASDLSGRVPETLLHLVRPGWELYEPVRLFPCDLLPELQEDLAVFVPRAAGSNLTVVGREHDGTFFGFLPTGSTVVRLVDGHPVDTGTSIVDWIEQQLEEASPRLWAATLESLRCRGGGSRMSDAELDRREQLAGFKHPAPLRSLLAEIGALHWPLSVVSPADFEAGASTPAGVLWFGARDGVLYGFEKGDGDDDLVVSFDPDNDPETVFAEDSFRWWLMGEVAIAEQSEFAADRWEEVEELLRECNPQVQPQDRSKIEAFARRHRVHLPSEYTRFLVRVGAIDWPLRVLALDAIERLERSSDGEASVLLPVASDGRGSSYGFVRFSDEVHRFDGKLQSTGEDFLSWIEGAATELPPMGGELQREEEPATSGATSVVEELLLALVERTWLEVKSPESIPTLAARVEVMIEREGPLALRDLDEWLLDQDEVVELYCDRDQLLELARQLHGG